MRGAAAVGGNALSELSMRAVAVLVACCWSGLSWQGTAALLESDAVLLLLLLLLLIGDAMPLSLVAGGAGGGGHLQLTEKLTVQRVWSNFACVVMEPQETPRNNRVQEESCCFTAVRSCSAS